jgi:hypothetical protein
MEEIAATWPYVTRRASLFLRDCRLLEYIYLFDQLST